jgi:hypothetical protein
MRLIIPTGIRLMVNNINEIINVNNNNSNNNKFYFPMSVSLRSILTRSSHQRRGLPKGLFLVDLSAKTL